MTIDAGGGEFWNGTYPYNPHPQPWAAQRPGDAIAMATAVSEALVRQTALELSRCREVEAELDGAPAGTLPMAWKDLTPDERALVPRVLVLRPGPKRRRSKARGMC